MQKFRRKWHTTSWVYPIGDGVGRGSTTGDNSDV